ncbi:MAG: ThiF family adenylyltransferase [Colwellia sp.]|nr:ThiF family adenylyltransferase [Colwellia sp.]
MLENVNEIDSLLAPYGARRLSKKELKHYSNYFCGWQLEIELVDGAFVLLDMLLDKKYPHSVPSLFLVCPKLKPHDIPHLESGGKLCVWGDRYIIDVNNLDYILELLLDAATFLNKALKGQLDQDFRDEFLSYWAYNCKSKTQIKSLCNIENKDSRQVYVYKSKTKGFLFADSKADITLYLDNEGVLPRKEKTKLRNRVLSAIQPSVLICFKQAWTPSDYPSNVGDLIQAIEKELGDESDFIVTSIGVAMANQYVNNPCLIASFDTKNGACFVGLELSKNLFYRDNLQRKAIMDGFRNRIKVQDLVPRMKHVLISGNFVKRVDQSWVMGRDVNHSWIKLKSNRIAVIGCGSVGASTARLLVQSGVHELLLFDSDSIKSENISRHCLGSKYLGWNKASALSHALKLDFPHVIIHAFENDWQEAIQDEICQMLFERSDLILSCTADWFSDQKLLRLQSDSTFATIVFAFVEAHAMAAHVIVNPADSDAFNSLHFMDTAKVGKMIHPVTEWDHETYVNVPACAGAFQPYGVIALTHLHAMAAEQIISLLLTEDDHELNPRRKIWFESKNKLNVLGGKWSSSWEKEYGDPGAGNHERTLVYLGQKWISEHD